MAATTTPSTTVPARVARILCIQLLLVTRSPGHDGNARSEARRVADLRRVTVAERVEVLDEVAGDVALVGHRIVTGALGAVAVPAPTRDVEHREVGHREDVVAAALEGARRGHEDRDDAGVAGGEVREAR